MTTNCEFGEQTEAKEVVSTFADSVKGKTILITGVGPNGLGAALAEALMAQAPALLVLTGRTLSKVEAVTKAIASAYPGVEIRALKLDLASFDSINTASIEVNAYPEQSIDILINNAGVMNIPDRTLSTDGFEMHLATNYLGAFLFTNNIMSKLISNGGGRIVNLGSNGYVFSPFRFADYNFEENLLPENEYPPKALCEAYGLPWGLGYLPTIAYGQSKTAAILYTVQLGNLLSSKGVTTVCVHPGAIATNLWRHMPKENVERIFAMMPMKSLSQGASTPLVAALDPKLAGKGDLITYAGPSFADDISGSCGVYLDNCQPQRVVDFAIDNTNAERLWKLSEGLVQKSFLW